MQDFCFYTSSSSETAIVSALSALGLTVLDDCGVERPVGDYCYAGSVNASDGVYAVYRATDDQAAVIEAATWPDGVTLVDPPDGVPMFGGEWLKPDLATLQAEACARVDARAEDLRNAVVTPGSGQMAAYRRKEEQARAILQDPEPNETKYPAIYNEVGITANTAQEVAEEILAKAAAWWEAGDVIERARLAGKRAVLAATSVAAIQAAEASVNWP